VRYYLVLLLSLFFQPCCASEIHWFNIAPALHYTYIPLTHIAGTGKLHAFQLDLNQYQLKLVFAPEQHQLATSVQKMGKFHKALISINGGFFTPELRPLGLRLQQTKQISPIKDISWWGVFYIKQNQAGIMNSHQFQKEANIDLALQSGPRLIINGHIPRLKPGYAARSAICITNNKKIILATTENATITTSQLAKILRAPNKQGGLDCWSALNLDGGSSAQLYANLPNFKLHVTNFSAVTDAIIVVPR
jgi:uncharacterized protein YigE (DUF2233 family)